MAQPTERVVTDMGPDVSQPAERVATATFSFFIGEDSWIVTV